MPVSVHVNNHTHKCRRPFTLLRLNITVWIHKITVVMNTLNLNVSRALVNACIVCTPRQTNCTYVVVSKLYPNPVHFFSMQHTISTQAAHKLIPHIHQLFNSTNNPFSVKMHISNLLWTVAVIHLFNNGFCLWHFVSPWTIILWNLFWASVFTGLMKLCIQK